ncbi:MAG: hypothetical protein IH840_10075 [Candidatus Heimdallarchaeota archaeon]|nr:hypothetical protein [Candidatus Heimdallarchaeota archaeon]
MEFSVFNGCKNCGNTRFKLKTKKDEIPSSTIFDITKADVCLKIHSRGVFSFNIANLFDASRNKDPLVVQDQNGVINFVYNTE